MSEEKATKHNVIVRLISKTPITYSAAVFALAKAIDLDILTAEDLLIIGYDFNDSETGTPSRQPSESARKLKELATRSPGALGDLLALLKGRSKRDLYIGFCAVILLGTLVYKWIFRLITGTF